MLKPNQKIVMRIVMDWCRYHTDPISQIEIAIEAKKQMPLPTIKATLLSLIRKKYLRKAVNVKPIAYVKLRNLDYYEYEEYYNKK
jgi:hypothetical protein